MPIDAASPPILGDHVGAGLLGRISPVVWRLQVAGLLTIAVTTYFPAWSHLQEYAFFTLLAVALATALAEGRPLVFPSPLHLPIALLLGWVLLSVPFAVDPSYSFAEWRKLAAKLLLFYWAVGVWRIALEQHGTRMNERLLLALAIGSLALSLYALPDFWQRGGTWTDRPVRAQAPSSDYNWLSTYMVMSLPLLAAAAWCAPQRWMRWSSASVALFALLAQISSYTRAGWLGMLAQAVTAGFLLERRRLVVTAVIGAVVLVAVLVGLGAAGYHQDTLHPWTLEARVAVWGLMLQEIADHPLVGVGYGTNTFMTRLGHHPETLKAGGSHNFFLMVAMGSGLPALGFLVWTMAAGAAECVRLSRRPGLDRFTWALLLATVLMIIGFAVRNGFDAMFNGSLACLFWLLLAVAIAQERLPRPARSGTVRTGWDREAA
jgi:heptosyltransferase-3/putative inorganic carbon (HCO3(-)) transporter